MKKVVILAGMMVAVLFTQAALAQGKVGYINMQELIQSMPETKIADTALQKFGNDLRQQIDASNQEYQTKLIDYQKKVDSMSDAIKEIKARELSNLQKNIQDLNQNAQDSYQQKNQQLLQPIIDKAKKTVEAVAKEKGYTYVIDNSSGILVASPAGDDLLSAVKAKLGIK